jgi:hypothetical protein
MFFLLSVRELDNKEGKSLQGLTIKTFDYLYK